MSNPAFMEAQNQWSWLEMAGLVDPPKHCKRVGRKTKEEDEMRGLMTRSAAAVGRPYKDKLFTTAAAMENNKENWYSCSSNVSSCSSSGALVVRSDGNISVPTTNSVGNISSCMNEPASSIPSMLAWGPKMSAVGGVHDEGVAGVGIGIGGSRIKRKLPATTSVQPLSVAARLRRRKIAERIGILSEIIPDASKLDTASMLDLAITHLHFLRSQLLSLSNDACIQDHLLTNSTTTTTTAVLNHHNYYYYYYLQQQQQRSRLLIHRLLSSPSIQGLLMKQGYCLITLLQSKLLGFHPF